MRAFMDSLSRAYPDIPRDSLFRHMRRTRPEREIPEWLTEADFRKNDISLDFGENIRKYFREWDMSGSVSFGKTSIMTPYFPLWNSINDFKGTFDNNSIGLEKMNIRSGKSNLTATGSLTGLRGMILGRGFLNLDVDVASDSLDLNQIFAAYSAGSSFETSDLAGKDLSEMEDDEVEEMIVSDSTATADTQMLVCLVTSVLKTPCMLISAPEISAIQIPCISAFSFPDKIFSVPLEIGFPDFPENMPVSGLDICLLLRYTHTEKYIKR